MLGAMDMGADMRLLGPRRGLGSPMMVSSPSMHAWKPAKRFLCRLQPCIAMLGGFVACKCAVLLWVWSIVAHWAQGSVSLLHANYI